MSYGACVASELRAEAARQRISGRTLAHHVRRPTTTVSRWLNGGTPISLDDLHLLCIELKVTTAEIAARAQETFERGLQITRPAASSSADQQVTYVTKR